LGFESEFGAGLADGGDRFAPVLAVLAASGLAAQRGVVVVGCDAVAVAIAAVYARTKNSKFLIPHSHSGVFSKVLP